MQDISELLSAFRGGKNGKKGWKKCGSPVEYGVLGYSD
jgi:hypothetical protein